MLSSNDFELVTKSAQHLRALLPQELKSPAIGIICGSGLGGLADAVRLTPRFESYYRDIPHFPRSTVQGHVGKLLFGLIGPQETSAVFMVGRAHYYEGHSMEEITFPIRVLRLLDVNTLIGTGPPNKTYIHSNIDSNTTVTNAAGGLNSSYAVGDVVVVGDHLNLAGLAGIHPLRGPNRDGFGPRFPALSDAYDLGLRRLAHQVWQKMARNQASRQLHEGVYAFVSGPSYETRAECRMLQRLGADLVGMSTVPEIIVARHCGIRVLALSLVTNKAVLDPGPQGDDVRLEGASAEQLNTVIAKGKANHEEVIEAGHQAARDMQGLVQGIIETVFPR